MNTDRIPRILRQCVRDFDLDLEGLVVMTEAATGAYRFSPVMVALAGAERVYAVTADSKHGSKEEVREQTYATAGEWGVADRIEVVFNRTPELIGECDIVTNSGFVRPIDRAFVAAMKPTAVIPLMWETWELRDHHLDLAACKDHGILTLGTDEAKPPHALYGLPGFLAMKLLFDLGLEGYRTRVLLLGSNVLARCIDEHLKKLELPATWFAEGEPEARPYSELPAHFEASGEDYDAIVLAEHDNDALLLGYEGILTFDQIARANPAIGIGVISGNVDAEGLAASGLRYLPHDLLPFGHMSYPTYELGPLPVLELYAAGLKVGQTMARARLEGMDLTESTRHALRDSPAMDFEGEDAWLA